MMPVNIRNFIPSDAPRIVELQARWLEVCPDMSLLPAGFYYAPAFENGKNIFCAVDQQDKLRGYAAIYPSYISQRLKGARILWLGLNVEPGIENATIIKNILYKEALERAYEIAHHLPEEAVLSSTYFVEGGASIEYLKSKGFELYEMCYNLRRDLAEPIPEVPTPNDVEIRPWRMETEPEQQAYLEAYNTVFQDDDKNLEKLQHFMQSELWSVGTTFTAFAKNKVVGSVAVWYDPDEQRNVEKVGKTEYVFVRPQWRKQGIASYLLKECLLYLKAQGLTCVEMEVVSDNARALSVYQSLGYRIWQKEVSLGLSLQETVNLKRDLQ